MLHALMVTGAASAGLAAISVTIWLAALYARAVREDKREQEEI